MLHRELIGAFSASSTCKYSGETPLTTLLAQGEGAERPAGPRTARTRVRVPVGQAILCFRCSRLLSRAAEPTRGQRFWFSLWVTEGPSFLWGHMTCCPPSLSSPGPGTVLRAESTPLLEGGELSEEQKSNFAFPVRSIDVSLSLSSPLGIRDSFFYFQWPHFVTCELRTQRLKESLAGTALILHRHSKASLDLIYVFFSKK